MKEVLAISLVVLLLLAGCVSYKQPSPAEEKASQIEPQSEQVIEEVNNLSSDIDDLTTIEEEINTTALDEIDFDLGI